MSIQAVEIIHFRNLSKVTFNANPRFNILYGLNGSGKTSLLEAIFFLSSGRSFRTRSIETLIQEGKEQFTLFCKLKRGDETLTLGTQRMRYGEKRIRVNGNEKSSYIESAKILPLLLINTDEHQLIAGGPEGRRQFINWGMFHVEQNFHACWQKLQQVIKHRNAVLKNKGTEEELAPWDQELLLSSKQIDDMRKAHLESFTPYFKHFIALLLGDIEEITLSYYSGWNEKEGLEKILRRSLFKDRLLGYTQHGPHRMELTIKVGNYLAKEVLSRGQQKLMVYALKLAQGMLLRNEKERTCTYLIDDFIAELDKQKRILVSQSLCSLNAQVFVTGIEKKELQEVTNNLSAKMFHVEQGHIIGI